MNEAPRQITLQEWDDRYERLQARGVRQPVYGGPLGRHVADGDTRLLKLRYDNSLAALRLWNFLLTEEDRLRAARDAGKKLVGTMKDLGTVPVNVRVRGLVRGQSPPSCGTQQASKGMPFGLSPTV